MRLGRTIPPAAAPISAQAIFFGLRGLLRGDAEKKRFANEMKTHYNVEHCFLLSSGKAALTVIFEALKKLYPERDEVLIPAFCCYSLPSAIVRAGLKIKLCDISLNTLDFDYEKLDGILKISKPLCIVSVHQFGLKPDTQKLREVASYSDVIIIDDAAQAMGGDFKTKEIGSLSDVCIFSLGRGKAFSTVEGGVVLTKRADIATLVSQHVNSLPSYNATEIFILIIYSFVLSFFLRPALFWLPSSMPFLKLGETLYDPCFKLKKMSSFQAGLTRGWLTRLQNFKLARRKNAEYFLLLAQRTGFECFLSRKSEMEGLIRFPLRCGSPKIKEEVLRQSASKRLGIVSAYPDSIDGIKEIQDFFVGEKYPNAKEVSQNLITVPIHPFMHTKDLNSFDTTLMLLSKSLVSEIIVE